MRYSRFAVSTILLVISSVVTQGQTPAAARKYFQQGVKNVAEGNLGTAFENYSRAIEISSRLDSRKPAPSDLLQANNLATASDAERVTVIDPFTAIAYTNRGLVRHQQNDIDGAIADFNAAIRISPGLAEAYLGRGVAYRVKGDRNKALADFDRTIAINNHLTEAYVDRAELSLDRGQPEAALGDLDVAMKLNPRLAESYYLLGHVRLAKKEYKAAMASFDQAIQLKPEMASAYHGAASHG